MLWGFRGRVTAPGPDLLRTCFSLASLAVRELSPARTPAEKVQQKVPRQVPKQVCPQVPTEDRDQTVGGCSYARGVRAWRIGTYGACEDLRPLMSSSESIGSAST
jgi:hypothetical protein